MYNIFRKEILENMTGVILNFRVTFGCFYVLSTETWRFANRTIASFLSFISWANYIFIRVVLWLIESQ